MRTAFIAALMDYAENHDDVILITADLGFSVFETFAQKHPDRFFNVGIAEATMVGMAAGLAMQGFRPVVYSIVPFATMRCFEQIRVDLCYQHLPVVIVGVGGGLSYGALGSTHHAIEDVAIMRALPHMRVYVPADPAEARVATRVALDMDGPAYIRLGKNNEPQLHEAAPDLSEGLLQMRVGRDTALVCSGPILFEALKAADLLAEQGIHPAVFSLPVVKPLPVQALRKLALSFARIVVLEEHNVVGGIGSAILEVLSDSGDLATTRVFRMGIPDCYPREYGSHGYLLQHFGLDAAALAERVKAIVEG